MTRRIEPAPGQHAWFIRYIHGADGWTHETVRGTLEERTATGWRLRVGVELIELSEQEWTLYLP
jgi:hypothetical protein